MQQQHGSPPTHYHTMLNTTTSHHVVCNNTMCVQCVYIRSPVVACNNTHMLYATTSLQHTPQHASIVACDNIMHVVVCHTTSVLSCATTKQNLFSLENCETQTRGCICTVARVWRIPARPEIAPYACHGSFGKRKRQWFTSPLASSLAYNFFDHIITYVKALRQ